MQFFKVLRILRHMVWPQCEFEVPTCAAASRSLTRLYETSKMLIFCIVLTFALIMATLWNRAGHYIFMLWFLSSSIFFPRLISAVGDWMSTILRHMVWPQCEFRMQV